MATYLIIEFIYMFAAKHKAGHLLVKIQMERSVTVMILSKQNFLFDDVRQQQQQKQKPKKRIV